MQSQVWVLLAGLTRLHVTHFFLQSHFTGEKRSMKRQKLDSWQCQLSSFSVELVAVDLSGVEWAFPFVSECPHGASDGQCLSPLSRSV